MAKSAYRVELDKRYFSMRFDALVTGVANGCGDGNFCVPTEFSGDGMKMDGGCNQILSFYDATEDMANAMADARDLFFRLFPGGRFEVVVSTKHDAGDWYRLVFDNIDIEF